MPPPFSSSPSFSPRPSAVMPLSLARAGEDWQVAEITGNDGMCRRLAEMGLATGALVQVEAGERCGPMILVVKGSRLAIGRGMAHRVLVVPPKREPAK